VPARPLSRWRSGVKQTKTERPSFDADDPKLPWTPRMHCSAAIVFTAALPELISWSCQF
jgi:hypothetical protein